jgi:hypothetical protein
LLRRNPFIGIATIKLWFTIFKNSVNAIFFSTESSRVLLRTAEDILCAFARKHLESRHCEAHCAGL